MAGLVPAIHAFHASELRSWMPGITPGMTSQRNLRVWPAHELSRHHRRAEREHAAAARAVVGEPGAQGFDLVPRRRAGANPVYAGGRSGSRLFAPAIAAPPAGLRHRA